MSPRFQSGLRKELSTIEEAENLGLLGVRGTLSQDETMELISNAKHQVRILQSWIPNLEVIRPALSDTPDSCEIKILIVHPDSPFVQTRAKELLKGDTGEMKNRLKGNVDDLRNWLPHIHNQERVELRQYQTSPACSIYSADNRAFLGLFLGKDYAIYGPQFVVEWAGQSTIGKSLARYFDDLWEEAIPVELG